MPNHCNNELEITGSPKEVQKVVAFLKGDMPIYAGEKGPADKSDLCFNKVIPVPKETLDAGYDGHDRKGFNLPIDGYNWQAQNWGTKWGAYDINASPIQAVTKKKSIAAYSFNTAWAPPQPVFEKLGALFPKVEVMLKWAEPGCAFAGKITVTGEDIDLEEVDEAGFQQFVIDEFGYDPYEGCEDEDEDANSKFEEVAVKKAKK